MATCKKCNGRGYHKCPRCGGTDTTHGGIPPGPYKCGNCGGSGEVKCNVCDGKGYV